MSEPIDVDALLAEIPETGPGEGRWGGANLASPRCCGDTGDKEEWRP